MPIDDDKLVRVLKALADPKRLRMLQLLAATDERSCGELGGEFALSQPTISHHLKLLADADLIRARQQGQHHFVSLNRELIAEVAAALPVLIGQPAVTLKKSPARKNAPRAPRTRNRKDQQR